MFEDFASWIGRNVRLPGVHSLIRAVYPIGVASGRHVAGVRARADGLMAYVDTRELIDWTVFFSGDYESHIGALFTYLLERGETAIDVGANVGMHTLTLARIVGPRGKVIAFEPNPDVRERLRRNVELNGFAHVHVDRRALGYDAAHGSLRVPAVGSAEAWNSGMASLVALETPHECVEVDVVPLDSVVDELAIDRLGMVKIDVQGYEVPVLGGMARVAKRYRPAIVFEYEDWAWKSAGCSLAGALTMLEQWGYEVWAIEARGRPGFNLVPLGIETAAHVECLAMARSDPKHQAILEFVQSEVHG
ncbi:MAG: FkbM family methyltransferase [Burkholderiales bacterium]|nr:FkbM family methyltransferase [Burkholderiales bacterium]